MVAFDEILRLIEQSIRGLVFNDPPKVCLNRSLILFPLVENASDRL